MLSMGHVLIPQSDVSINFLFRYVCPSGNLTYGGSTSHFSAPLVEADEHRNKSFQVGYEP